MNCSSSLINFNGQFVLDTSVLINLHACKCGERILTAIPNDFVVSEIVAVELEHETSRRNGEYSFLYSLVATGIVTLAGMTDVEYEIFHKLTSTSPSLDDGEAATIAVAAVGHRLPVIDERRGRARASVLISARAVGWSLDLFRHPMAIAALGDQLAVEALYLALRDGRMRIPWESADSVTALIGEQRSRDCSCLPGYRKRFFDAYNTITQEDSARIANLEVSE